MLEVFATLQMREMMDTSCVHDTFAKPPKADINDWISSSIRSRSQILLHSHRKISSHAPKEPFWLLKYSSKHHLQEVNQAKLGCRLP